MRLFARLPRLREPEARNPLNGKHLMKELPSDCISQNSYDDAIDRRGFLKGMAWAGTGLIWSVNGGILTSAVLGQAANNPAQIATADLNFVQISDRFKWAHSPGHAEGRGQYHFPHSKGYGLPVTSNRVQHPNRFRWSSKPLSSRRCSD
jgi:3',5'-cyclic-AMP phosphodiesterase